MSQAALLEAVLQRDLVPESVIRLGVRRLLRQRLREELGPDETGAAERLRRFVEARGRGPVAVDADAANAQHYEVPAAFYRLVLGRRLKYSSGYWPEGVVSLDEAEEAMLALTAERARLDAGQRILELGCGWGSLSLWMAERHPSSRITAVSNSRTQKDFVVGRARELGLGNLEVVCADVSGFAPAERFDRVVSVEMFEHVRNWRVLLDRVAAWLLPGGEVFLHFFSNVRCAYEYEDRGPSDWMARHFFTGGIMPIHDLPLRLGGALEPVESWVVNGLHYAKTCEAWLANHERRRGSILPLFEEAYGPGTSRRWWMRWKLFFLACAELFRYDGGREWIVSHHRLRPRSAGGEP